MDQSAAEIRNLFLFSFMLLTCALDPATWQFVSRPAMRLWQRLKALRPSFPAHSLKKQAGGYWEIDLSDLEP